MISYITEGFPVNPRRSSSHLGQSLIIARDIFRYEGLVSTSRNADSNTPTTTTTTTSSTTTTINTPRSYIQYLQDRRRGISAFYRGLTPNLLGNTLGWAMYFVGYEHVKTTIVSIRGLPSSSLSLSSAGVGAEARERLDAAHQGLQTMDYLLASTVAGMGSAIITNPIWVIKTRMLSTGASSPGAYRGLVHGWNQIRHDEGLPGLYRGLLPSFFGVVQGALQFAVYESLKNLNHHHQTPAVMTSPADQWVNHQAQGSDTMGRRTTMRMKEEKMSNLQTISYSALAKSFAMACTYPYQVVRARLQTYDEMLPLSNGGGGVSTSVSIGGGGGGSASTGRGNNGSISSGGNGGGKGSKENNDDERHRKRGRGRERRYRSARDVLVQIWTREGPIGFYKG